MTLAASSFSVETLTLPHEDASVHRQLHIEWLAAYPRPDPIEQGYINQAIDALIEKRRMERVRGVLRTDRVRTALLFFDREQEDWIAKCMDVFSTNPDLALRQLTRTAAGCRWAIAYWKKLSHMLITQGTWYGEYRLGAIQLQGQSACADRLYLSESAYRTWLDCLVCNPNPKKADIDHILDRRCIPKELQDRDVPLWPGNPAESRARLQALVGRELTRLEALEKLLRTQYEEPARAEAQDMALASLAKEERPLLQAERSYEHSYQQAVTALARARKQTAAVRELAAQQVDESPLCPRPMDPAPGVPIPPGPGDGNGPLVRGSEHRSQHRRVAKVRRATGSALVFDGGRRGWGGILVADRTLELGGEGGSCP